MPQSKKASAVGRVCGWGALVMLGRSEETLL